MSKKKYTITIDMLDSGEIDVRASIPVNPIELVGVLDYSKFYIQTSMLGVGDADNSVECE